MHVQELWRYPVKSMCGERISMAMLERTGMQGDRNIIVTSAAGDRVITARTHPNLLSLQASVSSAGVVLIEGQPWHSAEALALTSKAAGRSVRLVNAGQSTERFDVLPLLVAIDGAGSGPGHAQAASEHSGRVGHWAGGKGLARFKPHLRAGDDPCGAAADALRDDDL